MRSWASHLLGDSLTFEGVEKAFQNVTPAEAGVQKCLKILDSGLRRNDETGFIAATPFPEISGKEYFSDISKPNLFFAGT